MKQHRKYLERKEGEITKFWQIEIRGFSQVIKSGNVGTEGKYETIDFKNEEQASRDAGQKIGERFREGYSIDKKSFGYIEFIAGKNNDELRQEYVKSTEYMTMSSKMDEFKRTLYEKKENEETIQSLIHYCESELKDIEVTPYHKVLKIDLIKHKDKFAEKVTKLFMSAIRKIDLKSIYFELNGIAINSEEWYVETFGYTSFSHNLKNLDWLSNYQYEAGYRKVIKIPYVSNLREVFS